jgi:hypothetical protein
MAMREVEFELEIAFDSEYDGFRGSGVGEFPLTGTRFEDVCDGEPGQTRERGALLRAAMNDPELRHDFQQSSKETSEWTSPGANYPVHHSASYVPITSPESANSCEAQLVV